MHSWAKLIVEELEHTKQRNAHIYAEILGYGLAGGTGTIFAMERAIRDAGINKNEIGYVNAHATSTPLGDVIKTKAFKTLFGNHCKNMAASSHGHLSGAAGNLEFAFTVKAVEEGICPPTNNLDNVEDTDINFVPKIQQTWISNKRRNALKNAFGFGGTNACLCIAQYVE